MQLLVCDVKGHSVGKVHVTFLPPLSGQKIGEVVNTGDCINCSRYCRWDKDRWILALDTPKYEPNFFG